MNRAEVEEIKKYEKKSKRALKLMWAGIAVTALGAAAIIGMEFKHNYEINHNQECRELLKVYHEIDRRNSEIGLLKSQFGDDGLSEASDVNDLIIPYREKYRLAKNERDSLVVLAYSLEVNVPVILEEIDGEAFDTSFKVSTAVLIGGLGLGLAGFIRGNYFDSRQKKRRDEILQRELRRRLQS